MMQKARAPDMNEASGQSMNRLSLWDTLQPILLRGLSGRTRQSLKATDKTVLYNGTGCSSSKTMTDNVRQCDSIKVRYLCLGTTQNTVISQIITAPIASDK